MMKQVKYLLDIDTECSTIKQHMDQPQDSLNANEDAQPPGCSLTTNPPFSKSLLPLDESLEDLAVEIVDDIHQVKSLWQTWSKSESLFDTWEFRYSFWLGYQYKPHFVIAKKDDAVVGVIPLWYEADNEKYAWFGSWWQEDNTLFASSPHYIPKLLELCPENTKLNAIIPDMIPEQYQYHFSDDDPKYQLQLSEITSSNDFVQNLKKKKRYNVKRDCRIIQEQDPQITYNNFDDFSELVRLSLQRFEQKGEEADWTDPRRVETFRQVIEQGITNKSYEIRMITVKIDGQTAAVDLIAIYNQTYYAIKCGYDVGNFPGIGNFMNILEIEDALKLQCQKMDFLEIGYGWKDDWFTSVPLLKYVK